MENLRIIQAEEKMAASPAPFSGALLFRHTPFACEQDLNFNQQTKRN
jgi:hypothetical protein